MRTPQLSTRSLLQILSTTSLVPTKRFLLALLMMAMMIVGISMPPIGSSVGRAEERSSKNVGSVPRMLTGRPNNNKGLEVNWVSTRLSKRVAAAIPRPTPPVGCCGDDEGDNKPHLLAGSYYTVKKNFSAKLLLNNKGPLPIEVQPTLFSLNGERFELPTVTVEANAHRFVDLRAWVATAGTQFREGSLQLFHRGKDLVLGAQIYLTDEAHSLSFEEKLTELGKGSSRLKGVWWLPSPKGEVQLVLSNTTDSAVSVSLKVHGESPKRETDTTLNLMPHETKVLDAEADIMKRRNGAMSRFGAISVEHNGTPGAVLARGMALEMDRGYSLPLQFSNPAGAKSNNLHGAGLRVAKAGGEPLSALVVAHNASQTEMSVSGRLPFTMKDGSTGDLYLPQLQLSKGETSVIDVTRLLKIQGVRRNDVASAGLEFHYTGELGSLITAAFSVSDGGNQVFRVPLWDIAAQRSATGGYPWYIEGRSSTVVYIKNVTDQPRQFRMYLMYPSGAYLYPLTTVAPGQTITVDIRALRDNRVPDMNGKTIPSTETRGQVQWSITGGQDLVLIGRSEQADLVKGISSNYSCVNCCGNSFSNGWLTPGDSSGFVGGQMQFTAMQQDANCYGYQFPAYPVGAAFSGDPSICEPDSGGLATGIAPGQAGVFGNWSAGSWIAWDIMGAITCEYSPVDVFRDALCDVFGLEVSFTTVSVLQTDRTAEFSFNNATLNVNTATGPAACDGDIFWIRARFNLPQYSQGCCAGGQNVVKLDDDNQYQLLEALFYENEGGLSGYADIKLRRLDPAADHFGLAIHIYGTYQSGEAYRGLGRVSLTCG